MTFPNLSVSAPNHRPAGDATTPAPQSTVPAETLCPPTTIPSESTLVTRALVKTSTPKLSKCRCALRERTSRSAHISRGPFPQSATALVEKGPRDMWAEREVQL